MIPQTTELSQIQAAFIDKDNRIEELMRQINSAQSLLNSLKDTMNSLVGDGKITIQTYGGSNVGDFTVNQKEDKTITLPQQATVNNGTLTIQKNGTSVGTFTANQSENTTANISVPTKTSEITNDSGFITSSDLPVVNDGTLTIQKNGTQVATFTANQSGNVNANITVPTATSELTNDSNYISDVNYVHTDNNFTSADKTKLDGIETGAEVNVQSNWNEINAAADSYIRNKPTLALVATSGSYTDLSNQPTIPAAQVNSDWNATSGVARILNKPTIPTATSQLTNDSGFITSASVPTAVSQLTNDSGYLTASTLPSMRFTYVVDNDQKLADWANNVAGNDYTSVLIKRCNTLNGVIIPWTLSIYKDSGYEFRFINLSNTGTKTIVGEPGSKLLFVRTYDTDIYKQSIGLYYNSMPTDNEYYMSNVNVEAISQSNNNSAWGSGIAFYNCSNLVNCKGTGKATRNAGNAMGFYKCNLLFNCRGVGINTETPVSSGRTAGFWECTKVIDCQADTNGGDERGMINCLSVIRCKSDMYDNCYSSPTANATYACANTLNGGWNT